MSAGEQMVMLGFGPAPVRLHQKVEFDTILSPLGRGGGVRVQQLIVPDALGEHFIVREIKCDSFDQLSSPNGGGIPAGAFFHERAVGGSLLCDVVKHRITLAVERVPLREHRRWMRALQWLRLAKRYVEPETIIFSAAMLGYRIES